MKILDRYILTAYLKTFFSVFIILMLIFVLQSIWLYIKELAGKDLDILVFGKFLIYVSPRLIPLVLPLTILLTSIMVFGNFAENYEFAAMKSSGISLQRAMRSLSVFIVGLGFVTFIFANNVIPWGEFNFYNLRKNIAKLKPAAVIAEGQFNQIGDKFNIKVEQKSGENDRDLEGITIHKKGSNNRANNIVIKAKNGKLISEEDSDDLKLVLYEGYYYDDTPPRKPKERKKHPLVKSYFETYTLTVDLSELNNVDFEEKNFTQRYNMLDVGELDYTIDSLQTVLADEYTDFSQSMKDRSGFKNLNTGITVKEKDSVNTNNILDVFTPDKKGRIISIAVNSVASSQQIIKTTNENKLAPKAIVINHHIIVLQEKLAIGFACIILFFVGAPLGALIRKGGIGLPMVIAILLFLTYHFIGIFAKNSAKDGTIDPTFAPWLATLIMLPLGVYLTKRATADRGLFEIGNVLEPIKNLLNIKSNDTAALLSLKNFESFNEEKLISITQTPEAFDYDDSSKYYAINELINRGFSMEDIRNKGIDINESYNETVLLKNNHNDYSLISLVFYIIGVVLFVLFFVFRNNKLPSLASVSIQISTISLFILIIYNIAIHFNYKRIVSQLTNFVKAPNLLIHIITIPFYPLMYVFNKRKIENYIKQKCLDSLK